jgi:pimeloyl-ACP methyl ester carboxylesterase
MPPLAPDPAIAAKQQALVRRLMHPSREIEQQMGSIETPTLVLFGTLDRMIPPEMGRRYKELMPNCQLSLVYDAGHVIATERPEAFCEVVGDFLERHEAFVISRNETVIHP